MLLARSNRAVNLATGTCSNVDLVHSASYSRSTVRSYELVASPMASLDGA